MNYFGLALELGNNLLKQFPNYDQRKANDFYKKRRDYLSEITKKVRRQRRRFNYELKARLN